MQINLYAIQNPPSSSYGKWKDCTSKSVKSFLGLVIAVGFKNVPLANDYWSNSFLGCPEIVTNWPKRKFWAMLHCLHLNDNSAALPRDHENYDRLHKDLWKTERKLPEIFFASSTELD